MHGNACGRFPKTLAPKQHPHHTEKKKLSKPSQQTVGCSFSFRQFSVFSYPMNLQQKQKK